jgi:DNA-binding response OmpR family regulator
MTTDELVTLLSEIEFTGIERRILGKLVCGKPCLIKDLIKHTYPGDSQADAQNLTFHIKNTRRKIAHLNHTILCECVGRRHFYRYVLLVIKGEVPALSVPMNK